jgi:Dynamin central region
VKPCTQPAIHCFRIVITVANIDYNHACTGLLLTGTTLEDAAAAETSFFRHHEVFRAVDAALLGTARLAEALTGILAARIIAVLPVMLSEVDAQLKEVPVHAAYHMLHCTCLQRLVSEQHAHCIA